LKVGQQLALTGDLGIEFLSKGLRISGFTKREKGGDTTKLKAKQRTKEKEKTRKGKIN
jgi:hypothetical protein